MLRSLGGTYICVYICFYAATLKQIDHIVSLRKSDQTVRCGFFASNKRDEHAVASLEKKRRERKNHNFDIEYCGGIL